MDSMTASIELYPSQFAPAINKLVMVSSLEVEILGTLTAVRINYTDPQNRVRLVIGGEAVTIQDGDSFRVNVFS
jgi:hypothetical protein